MKELPVQVEDDDMVDIVFDPASLTLEESESASSTSRWPPSPRPP